MLKVPVTVLSVIVKIGTFTSKPKKIFRPALVSSSVKIGKWLVQGHLAIIGRHGSRAKFSVPKSALFFLVF